MIKKLIIKKQIILELFYRIHLIVINTVTPTHAICVSSHFINDQINKFTSRCKWANREMSEDEKKTLKKPFKR